MTKYSIGNWNPIRLLADQYRMLALQSVIVMGILLASLVLPMLLPGSMLILILAGLVGLGGALLISRRPALGIIALMGTLLVYYNGPSGSNATMAVVAFLIIIWLLQMLLRERAIRLTPSIANRPLLFFLLVSFLSLCMGQVQWYIFGQGAPLGGQLGGFSLVVLSAGLFWVTAHYVREERWLAWPMYILIALVAFNAVAWLNPSLGRLRDMILINSTGSLFWTWGVTFAFSQALINRKLFMLWRVLLMLVVVVTLYVGVTVLNDWKSGWVPPLVAIATIIALRMGKNVFLLSPLGLIPVIDFLNGLIANDSYSFGTRVDAWLIVLEMAKVNPLLGLGFGNYSRYAVLFPIRGYRVFFNSHSQYVDLIGQSGVLGLLTFLWFFLAVGWYGLQLRKRVTTDFGRAYVDGALGGLAATLVAAALGDWVIPFFYNVGLTGFRASSLCWLFLGGLIALGHMKEHIKSEEAT